MDKPLKRIDHMMWDAEAPNSLVTIAGLMVFKTPVKKEKVVQVVKDRLLRFERFQKKIVVKEGSPMWRDDEFFQLHTHIHHIALPGKGTYAELQECISDLISQPLNYHKPLWDIHLIDNYNKGSVILWRVHHAVGDGMGLVKVVFSLTGKTASESLKLLDVKPPIKKSKEKILNSIAHTGQSTYEEAMHLLKNPSLLRHSLEGTLQATSEIKDLLFGKTLHTIYKGQLGMAKKAAFTEPLPLETFRMIAHNHGAKINDVLLALVAGAIRKHLLLHKQKAAEGLKVIIPVNLRKENEETVLHNEFSFMSLDLPVNLSSFKKRINYIKNKTAMLKPSAEPLLLNELVHIMADFIPAAPKQLLLEQMGKHIAGVITNVPGPRHPIFLAGKKVEDIMFWVSHTTTLGVGITLMSYNGKVYFGVVTDIGLVNDPDVITSAFTAELNRLQQGAKNN